MNILEEIDGKIEEYAISKPEKGFGVAYLERGREILGFYEKALAISETLDDDAECEALLREVYEDIAKMTT